MSATRMPVLYLSHGAPPLADDPVWTRELAAWPGGIARPASILIVSAHWEDAPLTVSSTTGAPLVYDFWGFPERYYTVRYDAPPAPALADEVSALLGGPAADVRRDESRGLDHGAYVPLVEMYPEAGIPVLQMSMPSLDPAELFRIGAAQASNSRDHCGAHPPTSPNRASERLWVVKPDPTTSVPASRSGARAAPMRNSSAGSSVGIDICRTGMPASGYISTSGT
ncbi:MAG TPA: class III extradiol ring-cleavage dioxygenase [Candidatus Lustribacter sp.]|nr:class III extradiol ring-cleavage dioxygenase [Candidatus Lustribacter sp.]